MIFFSYRRTHVGNDVRSMSHESTFELITGNADTLTQGFFCYMSKRKTPGYCQKHDPGGVWPRG